MVTAGCTAILLVNGEHYGCDRNALHRGEAHHNKDAGAVWTNSDRETVGLDQAAIVLRDAFRAFRPERGAE